jgi:hypothetical protein
VRNEIAESSNELVVLRILCHKKDGTNVFCSCREASDANYFQLRCDQEDRSPSLEYLHDTIDRLRSKYKISDFLVMRDKEPSGSDWRLRTVFGKKQE